MSYSVRTIFLEIIIAVALCCAFSMPFFVSAQTAPDNLRATIRAQIMSDPRTTGLSEVQIDAMVNILARAAQQRGVTANDLFGSRSNNRRPRSRRLPIIAARHRAFCARSISPLGLAGTDPTIPFTLGAASMALVWIVASKLHDHRMKMLASQASSVLSDPNYQGRSSLGLSSEDVLDIRTLLFLASRIYSRNAMSPV